MTLTERLSELVRAAFSGLYIRSFEHDDALAEIAGLCRSQLWSLATWDLDRGLTIVGREVEPAAVAGTTDPLAAIRSVRAMATPEGTAILVLRNFHRFLGSVEIVQALDTAINTGKQARTFIVVLAPVVNIPVELERQFVVVDHDLPDRDQLGAIARQIATEPGEMPTGDDLERVLDAAAGLTRYEAEGAYSLSLVRHGRLAPDVLWELKGGMLHKSGLLTLHEGGETFSDLGGLGALKSFCARALRAGRKSDLRAKGLLLLGPPGSGKSAFCKALGSETGRPTLILDLGGLLRSLLGDSEQNIRQALRLIDAMSPCVVWVDEVEKALAGAASSGVSDGGVTPRMFASFLTWLNDHDSDAFVVCTSNDITKLPPEFTRAERFDGIFFLDLPDRAEKNVIWEMYSNKFGLDPATRRPEDRDWTPAEICSCCRLAALLDVPLLDAAQNIVPIAITAGESVESLRMWAAGRCLAADRAGIYTRNGHASGSSGRRVNRDASRN
jgi:hypothetical protein